MPLMTNMVIRSSRQLGIKHTCAAGGLVSLLYRRRGDGHRGNGWDSGPGLKLPGKSERSSVCRCSSGKKRSLKRPLRFRLWLPNICCLGGLWFYDVYALRCWNFQCSLLAVSLPPVLCIIKIRCLFLFGCEHLKRISM